MAPPLVLDCDLGSLQRLLFHAAASGNLAAFKRIVAAFDDGEGRIREAVEAVRDVINGDGVLHVAAAHGRTGVCAYLVEELQMDVDAVTESGHTPLSYAVGSDSNVDSVRYLLDHGADVDKAVAHGFTSLHIAAGLGMCIIVELLLSKGADVNSLSYCGTPLHFAAMKKQDSAMKILLDYNADFNKEFPTNVTPLFSALFAHSLSCVKLLIKAGADVTKGNLNFTSLIHAANEGLTDFYECLLEAGADPNVPDKFGRLPIEIAAFENRRKDVEILLRVTSPIPSVHDWSVDGVLTYVKSTTTDLDGFAHKMNIGFLKLEGSKAFKRKDYLTAVKLYTAVQMNKDYSSDATLHSNRSLCWSKMGNGELALIDAEACRISRPHWPKACYRVGAAHMLLKNYEKVCDAFLDGLKLDPANAEMEKALREALNSLKISRTTTAISELSFGRKNILCKTE